MKPKPQKKMEKDPEAYLRHAVQVADRAPRSSNEEIEEAIRAYGRALLRAAGRDGEKLKS